MEIEKEVNGRRYEIRFWQTEDEDEIEIERVVVELKGSFENPCSDFVTYETFIMDYAIDYGYSIEQAKQAIEDDLHEHVTNMSDWYNHCQEI